jgi:hypothetical protein
MRSWVLGVAGIAAAAILVPGVALSAHGKAGLWNITTKMEMPGMPQMPDMSTMPPEVQARMKAMHMGSNGNSISVQHCMSQAEVDQGKPPEMGHKQCKLTGFTTAGHTYTGDMVCSGEFTGTGHMQVSYDSDEHYSGSMTMAGTAQGHPMNMHSTFEGQWVSADCGSVKN